ncbi:MAG: ImmA/IrrE family metallo-endopeptidase [Saprospiraceae bacterium]|nr:ImmA/IrrE family metallo-endopeptidase [Saprospiraceae bacterium]
MSALFGNRLMVARRMAGLSLQGLADQLDGIISRQALHKYEQGLTYPNSQTLIALSRALKVPVDFFFMEPEVSVQLSGIEFRKRKRLSSVEEQAVIERCIDMLSRYLTLERMVNDVKPLRQFDHFHVIHNIQDAENAAEALRSQWGLGNDPIPNVMAMLEDNGYKVVEVNAKHDFDGMKAFAGDIRVIAVNRFKDVCRIRFTVLHELAHHLLIFPEEMSEDDKERLCHAFAGAVLLPAAQAREAMSQHRFHFYLPELILLKAYWEFLLPPCLPGLKTWKLSMTTFMPNSIKVIAKGNTILKNPVILKEKKKLIVSINYYTEPWQRGSSLSTRPHRFAT